MSDVERFYFGIHLAWFVWVCVCLFAFTVAAVPSHILLRFSSSSSRCRTFIVFLWLFLHIFLFHWRFDVFFALSIISLKLFCILNKSGTFFSLYHCLRSQMVLVFSKYETGGTVCLALKNIKCICKTLRVFTKPPNLKCFSHIA